MDKKKLELLEKFWNKEQELKTLVQQGQMIQAKIQIAQNEMAVLNQKFAFIKELEEEEKCSEAQ